MALLDRLGARVAALRKALADGGDKDQRAGGDAFRPEPMEAADHDHQRERLQAASTRSLDALRGRRDQPPAEPLARWRRDAIHRLLAAHAADSADSLCLARKLRRRTRAFIQRGR